MTDWDRARARRRLWTGLAFLVLGAGAVYASLALTLTEDARSSGASGSLAFQRVLEAPGAFTASFAGFDAGAALGRLLGKAVFGARRASVPEGARVTEDGYLSFAIPFPLEAAPEPTPPPASLPPWVKALQAAAQPVSEADRRQGVKFWNSGIIHFQKSDYAKARDEWLLCRQYDPANSDCQSGLARVDSVYGSGQ